MIDINEASKILNRTPQQLRKLCTKGKIKAQKISNSWICDKDEIIKYYDTTTTGKVKDQTSKYNRKEIINNKPIALSFFSGAMGLDIGLEKSGFNVILASEIDNACRKTILKNKPNIALLGDIRDYNAKQIKSKAGLNENDDIDLVVGGPPCQAFSTAGKRMAFEDERGNVFLSFIDLILDLNPKYAVIENVRGLLSAPLKHRPHNQRGDGYPPLSAEERRGGALNHILTKFKNKGYSVNFNLYNAANFGTPQKRERVIIICSRDQQEIPFLIPTHSENGLFGLPKWKTFEEATKTLNGIKHTYINFPEKRLKYYRLLKAGQNWRNLPIALQKEALGKSYYAGGGKTGFLRRLAWEKPSPTLVTHPAMPATDLAHPKEDRPLSIEEYRVLQEFPDNWKIEGSIIEQYRQLGNAVPTGLGRAIGNLILKLMNKEKVYKIKDFPYSRYKNTNRQEWQEEYQQSLIPSLFTEDF